MTNPYYPNIKFMYQPAVQTLTGLNIGLLFPLPKPAPFGGGIEPWFHFAVQQEIISDVQTLTQIQRQPLGVGPTLDIYINKTLIIQGLPKRAFMALSTVAQRILTENPHVSGFVLSSPQVAEPAVIEIGQFIKLNITRVVPIALNPGTDHPLLGLITFYRTALLLGFEFYIQDTYNGICGRIMDNHTIDYDSLSEIDTLPRQGRLYQAVTAIMQGRYQRNQIIDVHMFWTWLEHHPEFVQAMNSHVL